MTKSESKKNTIDKNFTETSKNGIRRWAQSFELDDWRRRKHLSIPIKDCIEMARKKSADSISSIKECMVRTKSAPPKFQLHKQENKKIPISTKDSINEEVLSKKKSSKQEKNDFLSLLYNDFPPTDDQQQIIPLNTQYKKRPKRTIFIKDRINLRLKKKHKNQKKKSLIKKITEERKSLISKINPSWLKPVSTNKSGKFLTIVTKKSKENDTINMLKYIIISLLTIGTIISGTYLGLLIYEYYKSHQLSTQTKTIFKSSIVLNAFLFLLLIVIIIVLNSYWRVINFNFTIPVSVKVGMIK